MVSDRQSHRSLQFYRLERPYIYGLQLACPGIWGTSCFFWSEFSACAGFRCRTCRNHCVALRHGSSCSLCRNRARDSGQHHSARDRRHLDGGVDRAWRWTFLHSNARRIFLSAPGGRHAAGTCRRCRLGMELRRRQRRHGVHHRPVHPYGNSLIVNGAGWAASTASA
jgi:hypothetical protein